MPDGTVFDSFSIVKSATTAVEVMNFTASSGAEGILLRWRAMGAPGAQGFRLYRGASAADVTQRLNNGDPITGGPDYSYLDRNVEQDHIYFYRLSAVDEAGHEQTLSSAQATAGGPVLLSVLRTRPNPFDRQADITFTLPRASTVRLTVSDVHGRLVRELISTSLPAGQHAAHWDGKTDRGKRAATGIYFATLDVGGASVRTRLALLR